MDARILFRGLRARRTTSLLHQQPRFHQSFLTSTLRYNSTNSTPSQPPTKSEESKPSSPASPKSDQSTVASDFDEILTKLDLGNRTSTSNDSLTRGRRGVSDSVSDSVVSMGGKQAWRANQDRTAQQLASRKMDLKLGPTLGRQIHVEPERGVDLAAAIRNLQITCATNKIKAQAFEQRFYKRKGAVRKEQKRLRWRKLFKFSFQETVKKIQRMQTQGW